MIKQLLYLAAMLLTWQILACQNNAADKQSQETETTASLPAQRTDSLVGFKGCERAGFEAISDQKREFKYQHYTIRVASNEQGAETIEVVIDSIGTPMQVPDVEPTYFRGMARGHVFVEIGADPNIRELIIYDLDRKVLSQVYRTTYFVSEPPFVSSNGNFWFFTPVKESEMSKMPDCPDKEAWLKKDIKIGYGQRYIYNMLQRGLTRKSEYICAPVQ